MQSKQVFREALLAQRDHLDFEFLQKVRERVESFVLSLEEFRLAERIGFYAPVRNEVDTQGLFRRSSEKRKECYFPVVHSRSRTIRYCRVNRWEDLSPGYAQIPEPKIAKPLKNINELQLIFIPGIAFDPKGNRLGFGLGFYDRLLATFRGKRVALAYEFQIVESLPFAKKDERVDLIVTEERVIRII